MSTFSKDLKSLFLKILIIILRLVEEYMLLANIAVAHRIYNNYPQLAILRRHPSPNVKQIEDLEKSIKSNGYDCDLKSSISIQVRK